MELFSHRPFTNFWNVCAKNIFSFTWGNQDVMELQRNMKYYGKLSLLKGPVTYYDVQKLFAIRYEENDERRALEFAADKMGVEKKMDFHRALGDAYYTACILQKIEDKYIFQTHPWTCIRIPRASVKRFTYPIQPMITMYPGVLFPRKSHEGPEVTSTKCPLCHNPASVRSVGL